jgi:hypothetical protein
VATPPEEADPAEIGQAAARTVRGRFGVSLVEFVAHVVIFERADVMEQVMAGPTDAHTTVIRDLGDEIRRLNERIDELEGEVDGLELHESCAHSRQKWASRRPTSHTLHSISGGWPYSRPRERRESRVIRVCVGPLRTTFFQGFPTGSLIPMNHHSM